MTRTLIYFFRKSNPIYFSIEKLFNKISAEISEAHFPEFAVEICQMPFASKLGTILRNIRYARKHQASINHITGDVHYAVLGCSSKNINILTIHDCVSLHRYPPKSLRHRFIQTLWYKLPVKKADAITVISENTKKDLIHFTNCDPAKIKVITNFVDPAFGPSAFSFNKTNPRILFIGTTQNKNLERFVESLKNICAELEIVGPLDEKQTQLLKTNKIKFHQCANLSDEEMIQKYRGCDILAFPSTYEGFGLPIIEAQAVGRPVLTSDLSPMREVAGTGACLINPEDPLSMEKGLTRIINDDAFRQKLIEEGFVNVKRFRLETIVNEYISLYRSLHEKKKSVPR